jgi:hypothetical protein
MEYVETEIFKTTQDKIKKRTGIDIVQLLAAAVAVDKASKSVPELMTSVLDKIKQQATSSVRIGVGNSRTYKGVLRLAAKKSSSECSWWLKFGSGGQHDCVNKNNTMTPMPDQVDRFSSGIRTRDSPWKFLDRLIRMITMRTGFETMGSVMTTFPARSKAI